MTTPPQDDLTAERAASVDVRKALAEKVKGLLVNGLTHEENQIWLANVNAFEGRAYQRGRQEALREGRDYALACVHERAVQLDGFAGSSEMAGVIRGKQSEAQRIADALDRLASEGG